MVGPALRENPSGVSSKIGASEMKGSVNGATSKVQARFATPGDSKFGQ